MAGAVEDSQRRKASLPLRERNCHIQQRGASPGRRLTGRRAERSAGTTARRNHGEGGDGALRAPLSRPDAPTRRSECGRCRPRSDGTISRRPHGSGAVGAGNAPAPLSQGKGTCRYGRSLTRGTFLSSLKRSGGRSGSRRGTVSHSESVYMESNPEQERKGLWTARARSRSTCLLRPSRRRRRLSRG